MNLREEVARLTPAARRYARALVAADPDDRAELSDQLVQDAIVRSLRAEGTGRHSNLKIWLYVTINALNRERLRTRAATRASAEEDGGAAATRQVVPGIGRAAGVSLALDRLTCEEREALLLVAMERLDYAQACEILNIPRPTLIARLARARRVLAEVLDSSHAADRGKQMQRPYLHLIK